MAKFVFVYHGGSKPANTEEGAKVMQAWRDWLGGIGADLIDGGNPVGMSTTVFSDRVEDNGGSNPVSGYTLVKADSLDSAVAIAKGCPILVAGGSVEVAEAIEM